MIVAGAEAALVEHRPMLFGLAYRLLGSAHDADDVLQEAYLRWLATDREAVAEPRRYLSRIVTHLALDRLRARRDTPYVGPWLPEPVSGPADSIEDRETVSMALLHLLERLSPPERAVYVLHTAFELPYAEIAEIVDRTPEDCRQLHHRAGQRLAGGPRFTAPPAEQERLLRHFLAAARYGDLAALTRLLATDATAWSDGGGRVRAARNPVTGADRIARFFAGIYGRRPPAVRWITVNGQPAALINEAAVLALAADAGRITAVYLISNPEKLSRARGTKG